MTDYRLTDKGLAFFHEEIKEQLRSMIAYQSVIGIPPTRQEIKDAVLSILRRKTDKPEELALDLITQINQISKDTVTIRPLNLYTFILMMPNITFVHFSEVAGKTEWTGPDGGNYRWKDGQGEIRFSVPPAQIQIDLE